MPNKYKYTLSADLLVNVYALKGVTVNEPWLKVNDCVVFIPKGYAWDGCTLAPDFEETYIASCVHDACYQYRVNRRKADKAFFELLDGFKYRHLYYWGVRIFGKLFYR
jgi:hypothetical protein